MAGFETGPAMMFLHRLAVGDVLGGGKGGTGRRWALAPLLPSDIGPHAGYLSFLALVVCLSGEWIGPGTRSEPRNSKIKMRKRPRADKKRATRQMSSLSGINEYILAESLRVQIAC